MDALAVGYIEAIGRLSTPPPADISQNIRKRIQRQIQ